MMNPKTDGYFLEQFEYAKPLDKILDHCYFNVFRNADNCLDWLTQTKSSRG